MSAAALQSRTKSQIGGAAVDRAIANGRHEHVATALDRGGTARTVPARRRGSSGCCPSRFGELAEVASVRRFGT